MNSAPVAVAGPDTLRLFAGMTALFDGSASFDPDGDPLTFLWYFNADTVPDAVGVRAARVYRVANRTRARLQVTDPEGATGVDTIVIDVQPNRRPVAFMWVGDTLRAEGDTIRTWYEGSRVRFGSAGSHDPDGTATSYTWLFGDGTSSTLQNPLKTFADNGRFTVRLIVRDASNTADTMRVHMFVGSLVPAATFVLPSAAVYEGATYRLRITDAWDRSPADLAAGFTYAFDCGTGLSPYTRTSSVRCPARVDQGPVRVRMRVRDKDGATRNFTGTIQVQNARPQVTALPTPDTIAVGQTYRLDWSFTDRGIADGPWRWEITPGTAAGSLATQGVTNTWARVFRTPGTFTIRVRVTDKDGLTGVLRRTVVVTP